MDGLEVILGTYENILIGYKIVKSFVHKNPLLETSFTDDSHRGALRCVAISQTGILASSSTDDSIRLHSLRKRKEIGGLFEHKGTVNRMVFYDKNHMFSASEDGTICLWHSKNWELMRTLKGHKAHVMSVAVHPSGKLGLSVGSDRSFLTWDLVTGKLAFQRKLLEAAQDTYFTPSGDHYILVYNRKIEVCSLSDTKVVKEIPFEWRINHVAYVQDNVFAVGGDDRNVLLIDVLSGEQLMSLDAAKTENDDFQGRVRSICVVEHENDKLLFLSTASGDIKAFSLDLEQKTAVEVFYGEAKVRVTTMCVYSSSSKSNESDLKTPAAKDVTEEIIDKNIETDEDEEESDDEPRPAVVDKKVMKGKKRKAGHLAVEKSKAKKTESDQRSDKKFKKPKKSNATKTEEEHSIKSSRKKRKTKE